MEKCTDRHKLSLRHALYVLCNQFSEYVEEIYLFGSCARGQQKYRSDVDLLVRVDSETPPREMRRMRVEVIPDDFNLPEVDLKFSIGASFSESYRFNENIKKEGRLLWKKS